MTISIYMPALLVQIFLWGCVFVSFLGLMLLIISWLKGVLKARRFYWVAICIITMKHTKTEDWARMMFVKLHRELKKERPDFLKSIEDIFVQGTDNDGEL